MLIQMKVYGLTLDPFTNAPIVILKDMCNEKALPIWIGILEASAIATEIENIETSRPMTHDLLKNILTNLNIIVSRIVVNDLKDNIYYATIHMATDGFEYEVDARPSDAIAIALRTKSPIYVAENVLKRSKQLAIKDFEDAKGEKRWEEILHNLSLDEFGKYKM